MRFSDLARIAAHDGDILRVSAATYQQYESTCRKLTALLDDASLDDLEPADLRRWCDWLSDSDIRVTTGNSYRRTARAMLNRCGYEHLASAIRLRPEPRRKSKAMTDDDFDRILSHATVRDAAMLLLMADSGCRRGAIPKIRKRDLKVWSGPDGRFRVAVRVREKGEQERVIFGRHEAGMALSLWLAIQPHDSSHVFTSITTGDPLTADAITGIFRKLRLKARIPVERHISPHALRHRFAHDKLTEFDAKIVSQWLGHSSVTTTLDIYGQRSEEELEALFFGDSAS